MSWMRCGHPLFHFKGDSTEYIWSDGVKVYDYDSGYDDDCTLIEVIHNMIEHETGDDEYADKILLTLARKLEVESMLRLDDNGNLKILTSDEIDKLYDENMKRHMETTRKWTDAK